MKYAAEKLESIAQKLRALPPVEKKRDYNKRETVEVLAKEIHELQKRGYSLEQVGEMLRGEGLDIATPTLKTYLVTKKRRKAQPAPRSGAQKAKSEVKAVATTPRTERKKTEEGGGEGRFTVRPDTVDI
jgi:DNA-binding transcriptional MerR regulator